MKKTLKSILLSGWFWLVAMLIWALLFDWIDKKNIQRCQHIVSQVQHLVDECKKIGDEKISIRGKCLIWDLEKDTLCKEIQYKLPIKLREKIYSSQLTVFVLLPGNRHVKQPRVSIQYQNNLVTVASGTSVLFTGRIENLLECIHL